MIIALVAIRRPYKGIVRALKDYGALVFISEACRGGGTSERAEGQLWVALLKSAAIQTQMGLIPNRVLVQPLSLNTSWLSLKQAVHNRRLAALVPKCCCG